MPNTLESAWEKTQEITAPVNMSPRRWVFNAFYGILSEEQQQKYTQNLQAITKEDTLFKKEWLALLNPNSTAREITDAYSFILGYNSLQAKDNWGIMHIYLHGIHEYQSRTRSEKERKASLEALGKLEFNSP